MLRPPSSVFRRLAAFAAVCLLSVAAANAAQLIFTATSATTSTAQIFGEGLPDSPRLVEIRAEGTWGSTTLTVETKARSSATYIATGVSLTANAIDYLMLVPGDSVRIVTTGGSGISLTVRVR